MQNLSDNTGIHNCKNDFGRGAKKRERERKREIEEEEEEEEEAYDTIKCRHHTCASSKFLTTSHTSIKLAYLDTTPIPHIYPCNQ